MTAKQPQRSPPYWQLPGPAVQLLPGAKVKEELLGENQVLLHVTVPVGTAPDTINAFARHLSGKMPDGTKSIITEESVKINVHRPRAVYIDFCDNSIEAPALFEQIRELVEAQDAQTINITVRNNIITAPRRKKTL